MKDIAYDRSKNLFGWPIKVFNAGRLIASAFQNRIKEVAGFQYLSEQLPMRNSKRNIVYYLIFASQNKIAAKIMGDIFRKYN